MSPDSRDRDCEWYELKKDWCEKMVHIGVG